MLRLLLPLMILLLARPLATAAPPERVLGSFHEALYEVAPIYFTTVPPEPEAARAHVLALWDSAADGPTTPTAGAPRLAVYTRNLLWEDALLERTVADDAFAREIIAANPGRFTVAEWFLGGRFLLADSIADQVDAAPWTRRVASVASPEDFRAVASEFHESIGQAGDGWLALRQRGGIRDDLFDLFHGQDPGTAFGPEPTLHGRLYGYTQMRGGAGLLPVAAVRAAMPEVLENSVIETERARLVDEALAGGTARLFPEAVTATGATPDTVAYEIDGEPRTLAEARSFVFNFFGDFANPAFREALARRALGNEVVARAAAATPMDLQRRYFDGMRTRLERLAAANDIAAGWKPEPPGDPGVMQLAFFARSRDIAEVLPRRYKLVMGAVPRNPDSLAPGPEALAASHTAFRAAGDLRKRLDAADTAEAALAVDRGPIAGTRLSNMTSRWFFPSEFQDPMRSDLEGRRAGETSPVLVTPGSYLVYTVIDTIEGLEEEEKEDGKLLGDLYRQLAEKRRAEAMRARLLGLLGAE